MKKQMQKKLVFVKETVTTLNNAQLDSAKGGVFTLDLPCLSLPGFNTCLRKYCW